MKVFHKTSVLNFVLFKKENVCSCEAIDRSGRSSAFHYAKPTDGALQSIWYRERGMDGAQARRVCGRDFSGSRGR